MEIPYDVTLARRSLTTSAPGRPQCLRPHHLPRRPQRHSPPGSGPSSQLSRSLAVVRDPAIDNPSGASTACAAEECRLKRGRPTRPGGGRHTYVGPRPPHPWVLPAPPALDMGTSQTRWRSVPCSTPGTCPTSAAAPTGRQESHPHPPFTLDDMAQAGFLLLEERQGTEILFGQVARPWKPTTTNSDDTPTPDRPRSPPSPTPDMPRSPQYPRRALWDATNAGDHRDPHGDDHARSRRRFAVYFNLIGPISALIRRLVLRLVKSARRRARQATPQLKFDRISR
jgi:hypothetical protein